MQRDSLLKSILSSVKAPGTAPVTNTDTDKELQDATEALHRVIAQVNAIVLGKEAPVKLTLAGLLARGHLLIEDMPGVGKTTLAHAVARSLGLSFQRIQFTSDLLPADILGTSVFDRDTSSFRFHAGPIFSHLILADEVNRATPKAQSALLEAMEERQVTLDGDTRALPDPFFVIATQNPSTQVGTYPLPESQLDRFLMRIQLGFPDARAERALLAGDDRREMLARISPLMNLAQLSCLQRAVRNMHVSDALLDYVQAILAHTRSHPDLKHGLSPRCVVFLLHAARAMSFLNTRTFVVPEDLQAVLGPVIGHRLQGSTASNSTESFVRKILGSVPIP
ncbi:MAG: AAA family ATPase [Betaproteobacteria bacterium]|nr:AAA family ATPase [Betaproteobacteria bacterium]